MKFSTDSPKAGSPGVSVQPLRSYACLPSPSTECISHTLELSQDWKTTTAKHFVKLSLRMQKLGASCLHYYRSGGPQMNFLIRQPDKKLIEDAEVARFKMRTLREEVRSMNERLRAQRQDDSQDILRFNGTHPAD